MDFAEIFSQVWTYIAGGLAGIGGGAIVTWLFSLMLANSNRKHTKALLEAIEAFKSSQIVDLAVDKGVDRIKSIQLTQNIQPIVESEIQKAYEVAFKGLNHELELTRKRYNDLVVCLEKLADYFEYSYGVSDETKQELRDAIEQAKNDSIDKDNLQVEVVVEQKQEPVVEPQKSGSKSKVSR